MPIRPEQARAVLPQVDPARMRLDWPVGLRDGALLALLAAGLTAREISRLRASAVMMKRGKVLVAVHRQGVVWYAVLPADLGSRVLVWLTERRLWGVGSPVFTGPDGSSLSWKSIYTIVKRYRCPREARRCG
jgi:site-specific recombinase XerC